MARCIEMGAEDYLFKPVNPVLLKARVGASLEKKRLRDRQRELFRKFATAEVAEELLQTGLTLGGKHVEASVMFSDIRAFTSLTEVLSPAETIELLNSYYTLMFDAIGGHGGIVNQMLGDGLMAIFGAPAPRRPPGARGARGLEMLELVEGFNREQARGGAEIRIGIGIASGPLVAGFTGTQRRVTYTCVGDTVNLAAHLEAHTKVVGQPILIDENGGARLLGRETLRVGESRMRERALHRPAHQGRRGSRPQGHATPRRRSRGGHSHAARGRSEPRRRRPPTGGPGPCAGRRNSCSRPARSFCTLGRRLASPSWTRSRWRGSLVAGRPAARAGPRRRLLARAGRHSPHQRARIPAPRSGPVEPARPLRASSARIERSRAARPRQSPNSSARATGLAGPPRDREVRRVQCGARRRARPLPGEWHEAGRPFWWRAPPAS